MSTTPIREHLERFYNDIKSYVRDSCVCSDTDFKESVMLDVMNYAVHLAAADGNISQEERTKIAELFGYSLSEKEWIEYLRKRNLLSEDYRKNVPYTYVQVVEAENTLRATKQDYSPSKEFVTLYNMVANLILQKSPTSGVAHQQKENYLNNMKRYAAKRLTLPWCTVAPIAEQPPTVVHKESTKKKKNAATGYSKSIIIHIDNKPIAISVYSNIFTIDGDVILPSGDNGPAVYSPTNSGPKIVNVNKDGLVWNVPQPSQSKKTGARTEPSLNKKIDKSQIDSLLSELNALVGLESVKKDVHGLIHMQEAQRKRRMRGMKTVATSNHLVFYGNPGTGKTTVARLLAKIYYNMGILSNENVVEVDRAGLVAGYVGQTAIKVQEVVQKAMGGILFIDEAYTLTRSDKQGDFGQEAIDTLLKAMEDNRDKFIVIVAGYPDLMQDFINSNPGLSSRFNKFIHFEDYKPEELIEIFCRMSQQSGYYLTQEALTWVNHILTERYSQRSKDFANAREARNLFEKIIVHQATRLYGNENPTDEELRLITEDDVLPEMNRS